MNNMRRSLGSVIVGFVAGAVVIMAVEAVSQAIYPLPPGVDPKNPEALRAYMAVVPTGALLLVLLAWALGAFAGGLVASRLAGRAPLGHALAAASILLAGGIVNMLMIPHPAWFWVAGIAVFFPAAYLGARLLGNRREGSGVRAPVA